MPLPRRTALLASAMFLVLTATACAQQFAIRLETDAPPMTAAETDRLAESTDTGALDDLSPAEAPVTRARLLSDLRTRGEHGTAAAELLTKGFPDETAAVPVLVRFCSVDGTAAVVVVEAYGTDGKGLPHRRLWVFDRAAGTVIRASSFR